MVLTVSKAGEGTSGGLRGGGDAPVGPRAGGAGPPALVVARAAVVRGGRCGGAVEHAVAVVAVGVRAVRPGRLRAVGGAHMGVGTALLLPACTMQQHSLREVESHLWAGIMVCLGELLFMHREAARLYVLFKGDQSHHA